MQLGKKAFTKDFIPLYFTPPRMGKVQPGEETMNEVSLGKAVQQ